MEPTRRTLLIGGLGLAAGSAATLVPSASSAAKPTVRAVVELFTSQGCSSCPPADRLLGELARDPSLVVLSLPVDYWDGLGWRDTFAQPAFTARQRAYARRRGDGEVYTPQAVVDGRTIAVGSDRADIMSQTQGDLPVQVNIEVDGPDRVALIHNAPPSAVLVWAPLLRAREVAIGRGENARSKVVYTNIVRRLDVLGSVAGGTRFRLPRNDDDTDGATVLVQEGTLDNPGRILGAAQV